MIKTSMETIAEIIAMWNSQGYTENEIYRMLTAWDITIDEKILSHINQKLSAEKDTWISKQKH